MPAQPTSAHLKPEIEVLLCCARRTLDTSQSAQLMRTLQKQIDWPSLIRLADENGLLPLVCHHLTQLSGAIAPEWRKELQESNRPNSLRALFLTSELQRITEALRRQAIPALPYKGPVVSELAYGNALLRQFDDLDIVVSQKFMGAVYEEMSLLGYQPRFSRGRFLDAAGKHIPGEYVFIHSVNRAVVEFHTEATIRHFPRPPDLAGMFRRASAISLNGRQVSTFSMPDMMLMLCVHGAKDFWSRLVWVADVAAVGTMLTSADWEFLLSEARRCNAQRIISLGLWLAESLFAEGVSNAISPNCDRATVKIGTNLRDHLLGQRPIPEGLWGRSLYRIRMVSPLSKGIAYWMRLSTMPSEDDWSTADDGPVRRAPYALLRPLRLWRKYRRAGGPEQSGGES